MRQTDVSRKILVVLLALGVAGAEGSSCTFTTDAKVDAEVVIVDGSADAGADLPDAGEQTGGGFGLGNAVRVTPSVVVLSRGDRVTFEAHVTHPPTAEGEQLTNKLVVWSVKEGTLGGAITQSSDTANGSPKGDFVAGQVPGTYTIRAYSDFDPNAFGEATVIVKRVGVVVEPPRATLQPGDVLQFSAAVTGATNAAVEWSIVEGSGAAGIVSETGNYQATRPGTFHLKATSLEDPTVSGFAEVTVTYDDVIEFEVCPSDLTLTPGEKQLFTASSSDVTWSLRPIAGQPTGGATLVDNEVTAGPLAGTFIVRATSSLDPSRFVDATVRVQTPSSPTISGRVVYNGASTGRVLVTGEGGWAGTALAEGEGTPWSFKIHGAREDAGARKLRAWVDSLGTGIYVPGLSPTGDVDIGPEALAGEIVTIYLSDPDPLSPPPPRSTTGPRVHPVASEGALVCLEPVLDGDYEAASTYEIEIADSVAFAVVRAHLTATAGGPRCAYASLPAGTWHARSRARRGNATGDWSPATEFLTGRASLGEYPVTGKVFFAEMPPEPTAVAYVSLLPFTSSQGTERQPVEHWTRLTGLTNPTSFELSGVDDGRYTLRWALDFDGDGRLDAGDHFSGSTGEVTVSGAAVGNLTVAVPRRGAIGRVLTHTEAGGRRVMFDAKGFGATSWQDTLSMVPAQLSTQPPVHLSRTPAPHQSMIFDVNPGLLRGDIIKFNTTTGAQKAAFACTYQAEVTGVLEPVTELRVDADAAGTSMFKPQLRWEPVVPQPGAPDVERYEASLVGADGRTVARRVLSSSTSQFVWAPTEIALEPGHYEFRVLAVDAQGNTSVESIPHSVLVPPENLRIRPKEPAAQPTVTWDAIDDDAGVVDHEIVFRRSGKVVSTAHAAASAVSAKPGELLKPGSYEVTVSRRNASGQGVSSKALIFGVISPPILAQEPNRAVNGPVLYYSHSPVPVPASTILLSLMGGDLPSEMRGEDRSPPPPERPADVTLGISDDEEPLGAGTYVFKAKAVDKDGRHAESTLTWNAFDGPSQLERSASPATMPILTWAAPKHPPDELGYYSVHVERYDGPEGAEWTWVPVLSKDVGPSKYSFELGHDEINFDQESHRRHRWYVRVYDQANNFAESRHQDLLVFGPPTGFNAFVEEGILKVSAAAPHGVADLEWEIVLFTPSPQIKRGVVVNGMIFHEFGEYIPWGSYHYRIKVSTPDGKTWSEVSGTFCVYGCQ